MSNIEEMIKVMKAYKNGETIERRIKRYIKGCDDSWVTIPSPIWNWYDYDYRVKSKEKIRPYKSSNEMIEDYCSRANINLSPMEVPSIWIKDKMADFKRQIIAYVDDTVYVNFGANLDCYNYKELLKLFTYVDGSPIGINEEE